jgi:hypothetical protein
MNLRDRWRLHTRYYLPSTVDRVLLAGVVLALGVGVYAGAHLVHSILPTPTHTPTHTPTPTTTPVVPCCVWDASGQSGRLRCFLDAAACKGGSVLTVIVAPTPIPDCSAVLPTLPPPTEIATRVPRPWGIQWHGALCVCQDSHEDCMWISNHCETSRAGIAACLCSDDNSACLPDPRVVMKELRECEARRRRDAEETMLNFHCPAPEPTP